LVDIRDYQTFAIRKIFTLAKNKLLPNFKLLLPHHHLASRRKMDSLNNSLNQSSNSDQSLPIQQPQQQPVYQPRRRPSLQIDGILLNEKDEDSKVASAANAPKRSSLTAQNMSHLLPTGDRRASLKSGFLAGGLPPAPGALTRVISRSTKSLLEEEEGIFNSSRTPYFLLEKLN
jgi:hypothetical protein